MCIASLLNCKFAILFASTVGEDAFVNSSSGRGKNAFAHRCWTQSYGSSDERWAVEIAVTLSCTVLY
jgi:hypothetical protein